MAVFAIDATSPTPPFEQLKRQVLESARTGVLPAGSRMPTVRSLADELGLAANTVARAYRELERDGVIETRGRSGTFVAWSGDAAERDAQEAARRFADLVRSRGLDPARALELVRAALASSARD